MATQVWDRYGNQIELTDVRKYTGLLFDYTHFVAVVKLVRNNFVLTAYGIEQKRRSR